MANTVIYKQGSRPNWLQAALRRILLGSSLIIAAYGWFSRAPQRHEALLLLAGLALVLFFAGRQSPRTSAHDHTFEAARFRTLIRHAPEAVVVLDATTQKFIEANQKALKLFDYDLASLRKLGPVDVSPRTQPNGGASKSLAKRRIGEALLGQAPIFEWTHQDRAGNPIPCEVRLVRLPSKDQVLVRGSILDLSKDKRTAESQAKLLVDENRRTEELASLAIAGASISSSLDLDKVLNVVARQLTNLLDVHVAVLSDWNVTSKAFETKSIYLNQLHKARHNGFEPTALAGKLNSEEVLSKSQPIQKRASDPDLSKGEKRAMNAARVSAVLLLPLVTQGKIGGIVELQDTREDRVFGEHEVYLAQTLCHQAAIAIENARLFQATRRQLDELTLLQHVSGVVTEATSEDELIERTTQLIRSGLFPDNFGILLLTRSGEELHLHSSYEATDEIKSQRVRLGEGVTGRVAASGQPMRVPDIREQQGYLGYDHETRSELAVPMKIGNRVIGVVNAESHQPNHFTEADERVLLTIAGQLASGIVRLRKEAAERQRSRQLAFLNELTAEMSGVLDRRRLFEIIVERLNHQMDYYSTEIYALDDEGKQIMLQAAAGAYKGLAAAGGYQQNATDGLLGLAARTGEIVVANNVSQHSEHMEIEGMETVRSQLVIPVKIYKKVVLLLNMSCENLGAFDETEVSALSTLADQISISLESINLFDATRRQLQELTVLHAIANAAVTSRSEDELLERTTEIIGATIYPDKFGFLMLDDEAQVLRPHHSYRGINDAAREMEVPLNTGIAGTVAATKKPWRVPDVRKEPKYLDVNPAMLSELCVPIQGSTDTYGVINTESGQLDHFTDADMRLLSTIAGQIGNAIERLRLFESERVQRQEAETLREVAEILGATTDSSTVLSLILEQLKRLVPFDSASIQFVSEGHLILRAAAGALPPDVIGFKLPINQDKLAHPILYEKKTVLHGDITGHPGWLNAPGTEHIKSWIGAPLIVRGECIGVLTVDGYTINQFTRQEADLVATFAIHAGIAMENTRLIEEVQDAFVQTVTALANAIDARDSYTSGHSQRLADLATQTGKLLGCGSEELERIHWAALLHDIGKIGVPDSILRKPGELTSEEERIMRQHPEIGARIVQPVAKLSSVAPIIRAHQEHYDGTGYPDNLRGANIPQIARIISVADAYVAMTDERIYRPAMTHEEAIEELARCSGSQFDPAVVKAFLKVIRSSEKRPD